MKRNPPAEETLKVFLNLEQTSYTTIKANAKTTVSTILKTLQPRYGVASHASGHETLSSSASSVSSSSRAAAEHSLFLIDTNSTTFNMRKLAANEMVLILIQKCKHYLPVNT